MEERLQAILDDLSRGGALPAADRSRALKRAAWLAEATTDDQQALLRAIGQLPLPLDPTQETLVRTLLEALVQRRRNPAAGELAGRNSDLLAVVVALYGQLGPSSQARGILLAWLSVGGGERELAQLANLLVEDPPTDDADIVQALAPLFQRHDWPAAALFPRLLDALAHVPLAAAVLDLANHVCRRHPQGEHPAAAQTQQLMETLGQLVGHLGRLEESPPASQSPREISLRVQQSVALTVSLCDALALIGDERAIPRLHQALTLAHRRLKTESAAALARLGDKRGEEELITLAAEPVARLRVLAYAKELGIADRIDPGFRSPQARAEAELTVWLAEPTQFGLAPQSCELIDHCRQFWPSFTEPVDCFLFRFTYAMTVDDQERSYTSIGIAGPLAHAFTADLADLPPGDIYAAFAGWHAEHAEIKEYDVEKLSHSGRTEVTRLARRVHDAGYEAVGPRLFGEFFGEKVLLADCTQGKLAGVAAADSTDILFFPARRPRRSIGIREAWCIYKGRKLLKTFNQ